MFSHQKFEVYNFSISFLGQVLPILEKLPPGSSDVATQLRRAAASIPLNIADGAGKRGTADKRRFYAIARGSALECAALFDVIRAWKLLDERTLGPASETLERVAAMLGALTRA